MRANCWSILSPRRTAGRERGRCGSTSPGRRSGSSALMPKLCSVTCRSGRGAGHGYRAVRAVPAVASNAAPEIQARTVLTVYELCHARDGADHLLARAFLRAGEVAAGRQGEVTLSPLEARPITLASADLAGVVNHRASTNLTAQQLGLLLSGEPRR